MTLAEVFGLLTQLFAPRLGDKYEFAALLFLLVLGLLRPALANSLFERLESRLSSLLQRPWLAALILASLPILLRILLMPTQPVPQPRVHDEFSNLLVGDTLVHGRLANPSHPHYEHFETIYVLQQPSYSSIYPLGPGLMLAFGQRIFGHPWAGVVLAAGVMCVSVYWMLLGWVTPGWAFLGGLLAMLRLTVLTYWMNSYLGGSLAAIGGALMIGAAARLQNALSMRNAAILAAGLTICFFTRPFEAVLLAAVVFAYLIVALVRHKPNLNTVLRLNLAFALASAPGIALTLAHNREVTGDRWLLPYQLSQRQYGVPQTFFFQKPAEPTYALTPRQMLMYDLQRARHDAVRTARMWLREISERLSLMYEFFWGPSLLLSLVGLAALGIRLLFWPIVLLAGSLAGWSLYGFFFPQYAAPVTGLLILLPVLAMRQMWSLTWRHRPLGRTLVRLLVCLVTIQFSVLYLLHAGDGNLPGFLAARAYLWRLILVGGSPIRTTEGDRLWPGEYSRSRSRLLSQLEAKGGKHVIFVRYLSDRESEVHQEWVYNSAEIDSSPSVWARALGPEQDARLLRYFGKRSAWLLEVEAGVTPHLAPYSPDASSETAGMQRTSGPAHDASARPRQ